MSACCDYRKRADFALMCKLAHCLCPKIWSPTWGSSNFAVENVFNHNYSQSKNEDYGSSTITPM